MTIKITHHPFNYNYAAIPISMAVAFIAVPACGIGQYNSIAYRSICSIYCVDSNIKRAYALPQSHTQL